MPWYSSISHIEPGKISIRGLPIETIIESCSYAEVVYLLLRGERPSPEVARLLTAILVSSVDHGPTPPSCLAARTAATCRVPLSSAVASGVITIGRVHGGAIEGCMRVLQRALEKTAKGLTAEQAAQEASREEREQGRRIPGFGHRVHPQDPRTVALIKFARQLGLASKGVEMAEAFVASFKASGKELPLNVDGTMAALLLDLGFAPETGNAFFIISRVPGLIAHILEESAREKPMRVIDPRDWQYDGPGASSP